MLGYIGYKYFYLVPENTVSRGRKNSIGRNFIGLWKFLALGQRLGKFFKSLFLMLRQQRLVALVFFVVLASMVVTLAVGGRHWLERPNAAEIKFTTNARLAFLDEKLVLPSPLPPSVFLGSDRPALESADRDWAKLQPVFRQTLLMLLSRLSARGYEFILLEGYRSPERQEMLAALGPHLTQARAYESQHQYGMAADLVPIRNGALAFNFEDPWSKVAYLEFGREAKLIGFVWGGDWKLQDYGHIEFR